MRAPPARMRKTSIAVDSLRNYIHRARRTYMNLMIVESPNKVKKIKPSWSWMDVAASVGHVRDLPVKSLGVTTQATRWSTSTPSVAKAL